MRYALLRIGYSLLVLAAVMVVVFAIGHLIGDPARLMLLPESPESEYIALRKKLGLDDPIGTQFVRVLGGWLHGDFGESLWQHQPALPLALQRLPATFLLALGALAITIPSTFILGVVAAARPNTRIDRFISSFALAAVSTPPAWSGLMLVLLVAVELHLLPTSGFDGPRSLVLPSLTLALSPIGRITPVTRASVRIELERPYTLAARAKGLSESALMLRATRNALIPILTILGLETINLLQGSIVVEFMFGWPGFGALFITAVQLRDLPLVEAGALLLALIVIVSNLLIDVSYTLIDPRVHTK